MLKSLTAKAFKAVPYLETSALMANRDGRLEFSLDKPNVIIGPNGAGKSALLTTLSIRFFAFFLGATPRLSMGEYENTMEARDWWQSGDRYNSSHFLKGLEVDTDNGPTRYFRPQHMPGNEHSVAHAMCMGRGWGDAAREYARRTEHKSSGQQGQAMLEDILSWLRGTGTPPRLQVCVEFLEKHKEEPSGNYFWGDTRDWQMRDLYQKVVGHETGRPLLLMDEPEQSLDVLAEAKFWKVVEQTDCQDKQVIVATHSLYPILHPERFNIIEAVPGYADEVRAAMQ